MKNLKQAIKKVVLVSIALASSLGYGASLDAVKKAGVLRVACDATYPPMAFEDDKGKAIGFDVDFATEIAVRLGVKVEMIVMPWDGILAGLSSNRYDMIASAMNITPERQKAVDFVEYVRMSQLFVTKVGGKVTSEKDLDGKVVAVQVDTTSGEFVEKAIKNGVKVKDLKGFKGATDAFQAVKVGQAEVIVIDEPVGRFYVKQDAKTFAITGLAMAPEPVGLAFNKADSTLKAEVQKIVDGMRKDGYLKKLQEKWFGAELGGLK